MCTAGGHFNSLLLNCYFIVLRVHVCVCVIIWIHIKDVCVFGIRIPRVLLPYDKGCMDSGSLSLFSNY